MTERRLIEEELPLESVDAASGKEKSYTPRGHLSTLHLWWARRPIALSRAIVFGSLVPNPSEGAERQKLLDLIADTAPFEESTAASKRLPTAIAAAWPHGPPKVLDCFAGGGTIPLEALRMGCDTHAVELNPVAHIVELAALEYPQRFGQDRDEFGLPRLVGELREWAEVVGRRAETALAPHFPRATTGTPAVFLWCRTMTCLNAACLRTIPLVRSRKLANSKRRNCRIDFAFDDREVLLAVVEGPPPDGSDWSVGTAQASSVTCPACGTTTPANEVRRYARQTGFGHRLFAIMEITPTGRRYRAPSDAERDDAANASEALRELQELDDGTSAIPDEMMVKSQSRRFANITYGIDAWRGLFNDRQLLVLGTLAREVRCAHAEMIAAGMDPGRAKALTTYLAFIVDKIADYDSSFCSWNSKNEQIRNTFPQQSIRMAWDYTEVDPFANASGSWAAMAEWTIKALAHLCEIPLGHVTVRRGNAQQLDYDNDYFDAVIVDPPYYDAFQYADLSDFFYVWLKRTIGHLYPELFLTPLTPKQAEIIENRAEKKSSEYISHEEFEFRLQNALNEMARVVKPDGVVTIVFAHTDVEAWERLLRALRLAGLIVTTSWPMRSERASRPTAQISAVLGSCVVLVCRKSASVAEGFFDDVVRELDARIAERLSTFDEMHLAGAGYFVSAIGPAFEVFAKYSRVTRLSGDEVDIPDLMVLARQLVARRAMGKLLGDDAIGALDPVSLLYLTWRWAYNGESIPADEAYKLERAFDVDLAALVGPEGLGEKLGSSFALRGPDDRKGLKLGTRPTMIDVMHLACLLWDAGRRQELEAVLGETGMGASSAFWSLARALAEVLPDGERERTLLLGLTGNQENLSAAAAKLGLPKSEQQELNWGGSAQPAMFTAGLEQRRLGEEKS